MALWTYTLTGAPTGDTEGQMEEPGDRPEAILIAERAAEHGVCDLFVLASHNATFRTAAYEWRTSGSPEDVIAGMAEALGAGGQG